LPSTVTCKFLISSIATSINPLHLPPSPAARGGPAITTKTTS
jgi:hypothetical protein